MEAARRILKKHSPVQLTAVAIAKEGKTSSGAFYIYFEDVRELLFALSQAAEGDMVAVHKILEEPWNPQLFGFEHASRVVKAFTSVWDAHREVLRYRNLEADRGDELFEEIRLRTLLRVVKRFAAHIMEAHRMDPHYSQRDAMAEASVLVAALERYASIDPKLVQQGVGAEAMNDALARILAQTLSGRGAGKPSATPTTPRSRRKAAAKSS
jgi:AcrR family transcriptional regulator